VDFRAHLAIADDLDHPRVVAQVEENQIAKVTAAGYPTCQKNCSPGMRLAEFTAVVSPLPVTEEV
jgi:hypothetical protein